MTEDLLATLTARGQRMRHRALNKAEVEAIGEEIMKGKIRPDMDSRAGKRALRRAIESVAVSHSATKSKG